jgi:UrcA family protein
MSRIFKSAIAALAIASTVAPAQGAPGQTSMRIVYGDLDMASPAGGKLLLKRIESAARTVCDNAVPRVFMKNRLRSTSRLETVEATVRSINIGTLTLAWRGTNQPTVSLALNDSR